MQIFLPSVANHHRWKVCMGSSLTTLSLQVLLRSNRIDALLSRLLPHGQLLFLNHRFAQSLEKEVAAYMAKWGRAAACSATASDRLRLPVWAQLLLAAVYLLVTFSAAVEEEQATGSCCFRLHEVVNTQSGEYLPQPLAAHCWLFTVWEASVQILFVKLKSGKKNVAD